MVVARSPQYSPPRLLVVEDDLDLRWLLVAVLTEEGYTVAEAGSGQRALELCLEREPDLIVLDLDLSDCTGAEFLERHRTTHECGGGVVVVSGTRLTRQEMEANRIDAVVDKPFMIDEFVATITGLLGERDHAAFAPTRPSMY